MSNHNCIRSKNYFNADWFRLGKSKHLSRKKPLMLYISNTTLNRGTHNAPCATMFENIDNEVVNFLKAVKWYFQSNPVPSSGRFYLNLDPISNLLCHAFVQ